MITESSEAISDALVALADAYGTGVSCEVVRDGLRLSDTHVEAGRVVAMTVQPEQWKVTLSFDHGYVRLRYEARGSTADSVLADATAALASFRKRALT
jgi:hypothetical protein